jgi:glutathione S-transferase
MLKLYLHPLSSYCHKVLIALYESDIPFERKILGDASTMNELKSLWPIGKFPVLRDDGRDQTVPESSIIIEYLAQHYPGKVKWFPEDRELALQVRLWDRIFDNFLHAPMQKYAADQLRPADRRDTYGVEEAASRFRSTLDTVEAHMSGKTWAVGQDFTLADCSAAPPLFYGDIFYGPLRESHPRTRAYLDRLMARPSYARALEEAKPYMHMLPK